MDPVSAVGDGTRGLRGRHKAAVLLTTLGPARAAQVFRHLRESEIEALAFEMAQLGTVPRETVEGVCAEASESLLAAEYVAQGGVEFARAALEGALGEERARVIIERLLATLEERPFEFLRHTAPEQVQALLSGESTQTVALVLANMPTASSSRALAQLPVEAQGEVAHKIASMNETSPEVIGEVDQVLHRKLELFAKGGDYSEAGGVRWLAELLNSAGRTTERNVIDNLADRDPELAEQIRALLFVFEDVVKLDDRAVQRVLTDVDQTDLALALRGVPEPVRQKLLSNVSQRAAELLLEEIEYQPPQRRSVVEEAQSRIVGVIRRLEDAGAIDVARHDGAQDEELL